MNLMTPLPTIYNTTPQNANRNAGTPEGITAPVANVERNVYIPATVEEALVGRLSDPSPILRGERLLRRQHRQILLCQCQVQDSLRTYRNAAYTDLRNQGDSELIS